jgi:hypothetical protein
MSHAANDAFFEREKITSHYALQLPTSVIKNVSLEICALTNRLYSSDPSLAELEVYGVRCLNLRSTLTESDGDESWSSPQDDD